MAFMSERPPSPPYSADLYFYDFRTGGAPFYPPNVNTNSLEGPCALSGNGRLMAFYTNRLLIGSTAVILLYDVGRQDLQIPPKINQLGFLQNPALSGDGRFLAAQYQVGGPFDQWVAIEDLQADSLLQLPRLNDANATNFDPALNGDGSLVAFASNRFGSVGDFDIYLYSVPGDSLIPLPGLNTASRDLSPSISADGRYLAFQSGYANAPTLIDVHVYDRLTHSLLPLPGANTDLADVQPAISPDGRYLAFATESTGGRDIRVYDLKEQRLLRISGLNDPLAYDEFPALATP
jgi:hypothetical protein